ncbi:hypothetical protein BDY24DRAFT_388953 [Mrakia frigida]|uniref:uncharacterized protein n=1 Tax=Mrakia frigida TaxID=29902 RepID=UPI003FCBF163
MVAITPLLLTRIPRPSALSLHRALQLQVHPNCSVVSTRLFSIFPSRTPKEQDPYRYRVTITPHPMVVEEVPVARKKPGLRQWAMLAIIMTANFMLLKLLLDRVDDRELGHLENERKDLVKKGAELRKALKVAREQWLKSDVQDKKQGFYMREEANVARKQMEDYRTKADELRDQWVERDVKEKAIELFTKEERLNLTEEKDELESQLKELRWEEKMLLRQQSSKEVELADLVVPVASNSSLDSAAIDANSSESTVSVPELDAGSELAAKVSEIERCLSLDARGAELKKILLQEKLALVKEAKMNNDAAGLLREEWNAKDASEKKKRVALKQEKARLADQAKDFVHELDEIDKQWKVLRVRIAEAKGHPTTGSASDAAVDETISSVEESVEVAEVERSSLPEGKDGE